jgi:hypothetical protein
LQIAFDRGVKSRVGHECSSGGVLVLPELPQIACRHAAVRNEGQFVAIAARLAAAMLSRRYAGGLF